MLSRRQLFSTIAAGATAVATSGTAFAQGIGKVKPADVAYQVTPMGDQRCDNCSKFTSPNICSILVARVVPSGWCNVWAMKKPLY